MIFDLDTKSLISGNRRLKSWKLKNEQDYKNPLSHDPIIGLVFNSNFEEIISGDLKGRISIWGSDRNLRSCFKCVDDDRFLTAITLDHSERRLITCTDNGRCQVHSISFEAPQKCN